MPAPTPPKVRPPHATRPAQAPSEPEPAAPRERMGRGGLDGGAGFKLIQRPLRLRLHGSADLWNLFDFNLISKLVPGGALRSSPPPTPWTRTPPSISIKFVPSPSPGGGGANLNAGCVCGGEGGREPPPGAI